MTPASQWVRLPPCRLNFPACGSTSSPLPIIHPLWLKSSVWSSSDYYLSVWATCCLHACFCALSAFSVLSWFVCLQKFSTLLFSILSPFVCLQKVFTLLPASANCCPLTLPGIKTPTSVQHMFTWLLFCSIHLLTYYILHFLIRQLLPPDSLQQLFTYTMYLTHLSIFIIRIYIHIVLGYSSLQPMFTYTMYLATLLWNIYSLMYYIVHLNTPLVQQKYFVTHSTCAFLCAPHIHSTFLSSLAWVGEHHYSLPVSVTCTS